MSYICERGHSFDDPVCTSREVRDPDAAGFGPAEYGCSECGADYKEALRCASCNEDNVYSSDHAKCCGCGDPLCDECKKQSDFCCEDCENDHDREMAAELKIDQERERGL